MQAQTGGGSGGAPVTSVSGDNVGGGDSSDATVTGASCRCIADDAGGGCACEYSDGPVNGGACCRDADHVTEGENRGRCCADEAGCGGVGKSGDAAVAGGACRY